MDPPNPSTSSVEPTAQPKSKNWTSQIIHIANDIIKERLEIENNKKLAAENNEQSDSDNSSRWEHVSARLKEKGIDRSPNTVKARYRRLIVNEPVQVPDVHNSRKVSFPITGAEQTPIKWCHDNYNSV